MVLCYHTGAQQSYMWGSMYPSMVKRIAPFCGSARTSVHNFVFLEGPKNALMTDAEFKGGWCASLTNVNHRSGWLAPIAYLPHLPRIMIVARRPLAYPNARHGAGALFQLLHR
jgi:hypothetical protein